MSPFKSIRKGLEEGEDVQEALKRMRAQVEGWKAKECTTPPSPVKKGGVFSAPTPNAGAGSSGGGGFSLFSPAAKRYGPTAMAARSKTLGIAGIRTGFGEGDVVMEETGSQLRREEEETNGKGMDVDRNENGVKECPDTPSKTRMNPPPSTPRMDGLRALFRPPVPPPATPHFGGLKEMLDAESERVTQADKEPVEDEPQDDTNTVARKPPSKTRSTPARGASSRTTRHTRGAGGAATDVSTMADDEDTSADMTFNVQSSTAKKRGAKGVKVDEAILEDECGEQEQEAQKKPRARGKKAVKEDASDDEMVRLTSFIVHPFFQTYANTVTCEEYRTGQHRHGH